MPYIVYFALGSFIFECLKALYLSLPLKSKTDGSISALITSTLYVSICLGIFSLSSVNFSALHPNVNQTVPKDLKLFYNKLAPYKISNSYTPPEEFINFESRKEIVIQGASDIAGPWYDYQFLYKPGNVNVTPPVIGLYILFYTVKFYLNFLIFYCFQLHTSLYLIDKCFSLLIIYRLKNLGL